MGLQAAIIFRLLGQQASLLVHQHVMVEKEKGRL
jgi:hypothetical protein